MTTPTKRVRGPTAGDAFVRAFNASIADGTLVKLVFGGPTAEGAPRNIRGRLVDLRGGRHLQLVESFATVDTTRNVPRDAAADAVRQCISGFRNADLFCTNGTWRLEQREGRPEMLTIATSDARAPAPTAHDRQKVRAVGGPDDVPWLTALGLLGADGRPKRDGDDKLRQVRRFVEILGHLLNDWPRPAEIRVVDMGCGKGYLTVAAYAWLVRNGFPDARVVGVERRPELVVNANALAAKFGFAGLSFLAGDVLDAPIEGADVVIALHACDTATDDALARAVGSGARLIVASPCCHKEVRPQLVAPGPLASALRHGLLVEREAELVTDALRADLLGAAGFDAKVFEFVASEHTARNVMITAERSESVDKDQRRAEAIALAQFWGIKTQHLASALGVDLG